MTRKRSTKRDIHILPDALALLGVVDVGIESTVQAGASPYTYAKAGDYQNAVDSVIANLTTWEGLKTPIILEAGAIVAKFIGKKTGLNRVGTKRVKLL